MYFRKKKQAGTAEAPSAVPVQTAAVRQGESPLSLLESGNMQERRLCRALRDSIPVIDAAIHKLVRLLGEFDVICQDESAQEGLEQFLETVPVNGCQTGIFNFLSCYFDQLLTCGTAVGELVLTPSGEQIAALYNADPEDLEFRRGQSPMEWVICRKTESGDAVPVPFPVLLMTAALDPPPP